MSTPTLMPHQEAATRHLVDRSSPGLGTLMAMGPRLGKSVSAVEAAKRTGKHRILVIAPVTILDGWKEEIDKWWRGEPLPFRKAHGVTPTEIEGWTFTNYETLRERMELVPGKKKTFQVAWPTGYDLIIIDESVKIKSRSAQVTQAVACVVSANPQATRWLLSANPAPKDLSDLWPQLFIADPGHTPRSFWEFAQTYCRIERDMWGVKVRGNLPGAEERVKADYGHCLWSPAESPAITPLETTVYSADMQGEQRRIYLEMEHEFRATLDQLKGDEILAANVMAQMVRLMQIASNPFIIDGPNASSKWSRAMDLLCDDRFQAPTIIWTAFKKTVEVFGEQLRYEGFRVAELTGDTSQKNRTATRHKFQAGEIDVLLAHPGVGKFGLNLSAANSVIWLERSWLADDYYQAGFRARHLQKDSTVRVAELLAAIDGGPTIDHAIHNVLQSRTDATNRLTAAEFRNAWRQVEGVQ